MSLTLSLSVMVFYCYKGLCNTFFEKAYLLSLLVLSSQLHMQGPPSSHDCPVYSPVLLPCTHALWPKVWRHPLSTYCNFYSSLQYLLLKLTVFNYFVIYFYIYICFFFNWSYCLFVCYVNHWNALLFKGAIQINLTSYLAVQKDISGQ